MFPRLLLACLALTGLLASAATPLDGLVRTMAESPDPALQLNILHGMNAALKGKRNLPAPAGWEALYAKLRQSENASLRQEAQMLAVIFGSDAAFGELRARLTDVSAKPEARQAALEALTDARDAGTLPLLFALLREAGPLRRPALRALTLYDDAQIPAALLASYAVLSGEEKRDALAGLTRRPAFARALLAAVDGGQVARADLTAPFARQLQDLGDAQVSAWLKERWGAVRTSSADKLATIAKLKAYLKPETLAKADANHGRALFSQTCAICHTLFGTGAKIGPELPGAFEDVDYLLQNIVDPNAIIGKDYQQTVVQMKKGETVIGIIGAQDGSTLTLKTLAGPLTVQRPEIEKLSVLEVSLMPEGLLSAMSEADVRDLFGYLRLHGQVPALLSEANLNDFNEDVDFARWSRSSPTAWKVEKGILIGHASPDREEFITSDFIAPSCQLEFDFLVTGPSAQAALTLHAGFTLLLTPEGYRIKGRDDDQARVLSPYEGSKWLHCKIEIKPRELELTITSDHAVMGSSVFISDATVSAPVAPTFRIAGELKITNLRASLPRPKAD